MFAEGRGRLSLLPGRTTWLCLGRSRLVLPTSSVFTIVQCRWRPCGMATIDGNESWAIEIKTVSESRKQTCTSLRHKGGWWTWDCPCANWSLSWLRMNPFDSAWECRPLTSKPRTCWPVLPHSQELPEREYEYMFWFRVCCPWLISKWIGYYATLRIMNYPNFICDSVIGTVYSEYWGETSYESMQVETSSREISISRTLWYCVGAERSNNGNGILTKLQTFAHHQLLSNHGIHNA